MAGQTMKRVLAAIVAFLATGAVMSSAAPPVTTASLATEPVDRMDATGGGQITSTDTFPRPHALQRLPVPAANPLWAIPLATLTETRERPLFSPSRHPPPPAPERSHYSPPLRPPPSPISPERPRLSLVGTIVGAAAGFGLFIDPSTKTTVRLKTGNTYRGWVLRTVREREVVLERNHLNAILSLPTPGQQHSTPLHRNIRQRHEVDGKAVHR